jgi:hypothetical protein
LTGILANSATGNCEANPTTPARTGSENKIMRHPSQSVLVAAGVWFACVSAVHADFISYDLGSVGSLLSQVAARGRSLDRNRNDNRIVLEGTVVFAGAQTVSYTHPNGTKVHFNADRVERIRARTKKQEFDKLFAQAGKDPDKLMKAGLWALKKALPNDFNRAVKKVLQVDPQNQAALLVMDVKQRLKVPLRANPEAEESFRSILKRGKESMRLEKSEHFMLLTDTPANLTAAERDKGKKMNRAQERLELLERVYESFILLFHAQDVPLDIPQERMMVVLFRDKEDFKDYSESLHPALSSAEGFWHPITNVSYFFDYGSSEEFKVLKKIMDDFHKVKADAIRTKDRDTINYVKLLDLIMDVERENSDVSVVTHECCHQMAGNTGLFPRRVDNPRWVHEGLATYFEAPSGGTWAGIGAVSTERLVFYNALASHDKMHSSIEFVASDQIFDQSGGIATNVLLGYANAWALTHFLIETYPKELAAFYRMIGDVPPDVQLNPDLLMQIFARAFGSDFKALNEEWRSYMRTIKTDLQSLQDGAGK